jgi:MYXO-CTERM domain-containing protein
LTYSIVAVDTRTAEVGGAGTSCLDGGDVFVIYRGVPGLGVVHAQARYDADVRDEAARLLRSGQSAPQTLAAVTLPSFDANLAVRQYGIVDVSGSAVAFTGAGTMPYAADRHGVVQGFAYSVQGNILTSARVLDQAAAAFESAGCDLPERLLQGLLAGAHNGQGDSRCTPAGIPSDSAFLQVERPAGNEGDYLALRVESSGGDDPLPLLQAQLAAWRAQHPCPTSPTSSAGAAGEAGQAASGSGDPGRDADCGCRVTSGVDGAVTWALLGALLVIARRRRATRELRPALLPR